MHAIFLLPLPFVCRYKYKVLFSAVSDMIKEMMNNRENNCKNAPDLKEMNSQCKQVVVKKLML